MGRAPARSDAASLGDRLGSGPPGILEFGSWRVATRFRGRNDVHGPHDGGVRESLLTADEVAGLLGVPTSWVYEQSRAGRIPTVTLGRYRRYRREAIEAWIEEIESPRRSGHRADRGGGVGKRSLSPDDPRDDIARAA